jgi:manganese/zinc/iron transport system substrate-binding protein
MMNFKYLYITLIIASCFGCQHSDQQEKSKPHIVTTIGMLADATMNIVGDSATVEALMGPGVDPHLYKATQGDLQLLIEGDIIIYNGLHLEGKMGEVLKKLGRSKPVIAAAETIPKDQRKQSMAYTDAYDPHVWFDVSLWKITTQNISIQLKQLHPENAAYYEENTTQYLLKLDSLHESVELGIAKIPKNQRILITAHDAFEYFGTAYGMQVRGLQGISTVSDFGLKDITELVDYIVSSKVKAVFIETSVSQKAIKAVVEGCRKRGFEVVIGGSLYSDAMGAADTPEGTYIGMVNANVQTIVNALK